MNKRVIICGYPKSGNTWLTRLTAEILGCPVAGFWCQPFNKDTSIEGLDRESEFQCFKAHHAFEQMTHTLNLYGNGPEKMIYIYRDPRSVVVSAAHYFRFSPKYPRLKSLSECFSQRIDLYPKSLDSHSYKLGLMVRGLIEGTTEGAWLRVPWNKHVTDYLKQDGVLALSYEHLTTEPLLAARQITEFLSISRTDAELEEAIHAQSFANRKKKFLRNGKVGKSKFLRKGETDSWRDELPDHHVKYIEQAVGGFMQELGYGLTSGS